MKWGKCTQTEFNSSEVCLFKFKPAKPVDFCFRRDNGCKTRADKYRHHEGLHHLYSWCFKVTADLQSRFSVGWRFVLTLPVTVVCFSPSRCVSGPRQQSELLRSDGRRHGCGHRLLGQFPPDLELNEPVILKNYPLLPPQPHPAYPNSSLGGCTHCVSWLSLTQPPVIISAGDLWESTTCLVLFTELLLSSRSQSVQEKCYRKEDLVLTRIIFQRYVLPWLTTRLASVSNMYIYI